MKNVTILAIVIASSIAAIGFSLANAIPEYQIYGDKYPILGQNSCYGIILANISSGYDTSSILTIYTKSDRSKLLTIYGSYGGSCVTLNSPKFIAGTEYILEIKMGDNIIGELDIIPIKQEVEDKIKNQNAHIVILGVIETKVPNRHIVGFQVCAGDTKIVTPEIIIHTHEDEYEASVYANIAPHSCFTTDTTVQTSNPDSIKIEFKKQQVSDTSLESLKAEVEALKKQLNKPSIPNWVKNNAKWWADKQIGDSDFIQGIQYLITQEIIKIPETKADSGSSQEIPTWIRNNAKWWADGQISDDDFISGIQYLISNGIMKV